MASGFSYDSDHRVLVCKACGTCLAPTGAGLHRHLRRGPHWLRGDILKATASALLSHELRTTEELRRHKPRAPCAPIDGLTTYDGRHCLCDKSCDFSTTWAPTMDAHVGAAKHKRKAREHKTRALWEDCKLQTYFTAKGLIDYFRVTQAEEQPRKGGVPAKAQEEEASSGCDTLLARLRKDIDAAERELEEKGGIVQGFDGSRTERIPWLGKSAFATHLEGLRDEEIKRSYTTPPKRVLDACGRGEPVEAMLEDGDDLDLVRILVAAEGMLRDAYELCSDTSPTRKMTQMRANILNQFYDGASGKANGFLYFKNESTLATYFKRYKELLAFYYRVVYRGGHFTRERPGQLLPEDIIETSVLQRQAMTGVVKALRRQEQERETRTQVPAEGDLLLRHALRRLYMALICHTVGSVPFRSPVVSFCAMLSRKVYTAKTGKADHGAAGGAKPPAQHGIWHEPQNYNSHLSALTWCAQLTIFDYVCFDRQDDENRIPDVLREMVAKFFQQQRETPFGHILQWRLLLFAVSKGAVTTKQARWSLDGESIIYDGLELRMEAVSQLIQSEYRQAHSLLYDELLLGATDLRTVESWRLHDDLDREEFGASWLNDPRNGDLLRGSQEALLRRIWACSAHRQMFLRNGPDGDTVLCPKAMALYEVYVQQFLERMSNSMLVSAGPAVRGPEHGSMTYRNTARRRHLFIWEKLVMVHIQYHKGQEQQGRYKENIRFLPRAVGDLLLTFLAYVQPLRQVFLRQQSPRALLSPFLWSKADGALWKDSRVSCHLRSACARASVPQFQIAWWRQVTASITQEKFSARERANLSQDADDGVDDNEDESELTTLAGMGNHTARTMHHAYAGTTTLTMTVLLHRAYRASASWQRLFHVDQILAGKRPRPHEPDACAQLAAACKKARRRTRPTGTEKALLDAARKMHGDAALRFRAPGQRAAILATLGRGSLDTQQVLVVLGTGSGKSLIFLTGAVLANAATTLLILPTVALRNDMIGKLRRFGIRYHEWAPGSSRSAPLVILAAEAACTASFLDYARMLIDNQLLDRVVIDECHLTITASDYRESMVQIGWHVGQLKTQTVWLTATLPPSIQDDFFLQNKLVRPSVVRESTNRHNIRYVVQVDNHGRRTAAESAARLVVSSCKRQDLFRNGHDKMIVFCPTKTLVVELAERLCCPYYVGGRDMAEGEKAAAIGRWLGEGGPAVIVATSALGPGFDYLHVRLVLHAGEPERMTDFSQESGRAGRDGAAAESIVLLPATWTPRAAAGLCGDEEAMQLYLTQRVCYRGALTQYLDEERDWTWCREGDTSCGACVEPHTEPRPLGLVFQRTKDEGGSGASGGNAVFAGPGEVLRQDQVNEELLAAYKRDLKIVRGSCLYCRMRDRSFDDHTATSCPWRHDWINAKREAVRSRRKHGKAWMPNFAVCWRCYQPQHVCRVADPEAEDVTECSFRDMVIPLCYGKFMQVHSAGWFQKHFRQAFASCEEYMLWLGEKASFAGAQCVQANVVAALALSELG